MKKGTYNKKAPERLFISDVLQNAVFSRTMMDSSVVPDGKFLERLYKLVCLPDGFRNKVQAIDEELKTKIDPIIRDGSEEKLPEACEVLKSARTFFRSVIDLALEAGSIQANIFGSAGGYEVDRESTWITREGEGKDKYGAINRSEARVVLEAVCRINDHLHNSQGRIENLIRMKMLAETIEKKLLTEESSKAQ